jgi:hypothetical protein
LKADRKHADDLKISSFAEKIADIDIALKKIDIFLTTSVDVLLSSSGDI